MRVDGELKEIGPGDLVAIPKCAVHQLCNNNATEVLEFIVTCVPPWTPDCSVWVED